MVFCLIWILAGWGAYDTLTHDNPKTARNKALAFAFFLVFVALGVAVRLLNPLFHGVL